MGKPFNISGERGANATPLAKQKTAGHLTGGLRFSAAQHAVEEALKLPAPDRMLQFAHRLGFDLPHPFARHLEDAADLLQRVSVAVAQAVTQLDDLALA